MTIAERIQAVRARIGAAATRSGRDGGDITLVAASKTVEPARIREAFAAGVADFGENRVQDLLAKKEQVGEASIRWHMIGALQRNKINALLGEVVLIHGVDSVALGLAVAERAARAGRVAPVLLEVNSTGEPSKHGVVVADVAAAADALKEAAGIELRGLMTIGPADDPRGAREAFATVRSLAERHGLRELSMGMTGDFEIAIEEGATIVRIGTAIFGPRPLDATGSPRAGTNG